MDILTAARGLSGQDAVSGLLRRIAEHDAALWRHGERTARYAEALARRMALPETQLRDLRTAARLHDIGRLTLPRELFTRDGPLSAEEYALVQSHPRAGAELVGLYEDLRAPAVLIAHHHERWDGYGYPYGLRGTFIPLGSRVLAIADTFDALTSDQHGRSTVDRESAVRILQGLAGTQLDPSLTRRFVEEGLWMRGVEDDRQTACL